MGVPDGIDVQVEDPVVEDSQAEEAVDFFGLLFIEKQELLDRLSELGYGEEGRLVYDTNFADTSQVTAERGEVEALVQKLQDGLDQVEEALGKLEKGNYGVCESCGGRIGVARLEANPAARLCINCASAAKS